MLELPNTYFELFLGYSAIWLLIAVYLFSLSRKSRQIKNNLEQLSCSAAGVAPQDLKSQQESGEQGKSLQDKIENCRFV